MIRADWLACQDPEPMLPFIRGPRIEGKLRLFACACCRRVWHLVGERDREVVQAAEGFVRGNLSWEQLQGSAQLIEGGTAEAELEAQRDPHASARYEATTAVWQSAALPAADAAWFAARCARTAVADLHAADPSSDDWRRAERAERAAQADLLRAIFPSPSISASAGPVLNTAGRRG